jgi:hypothetical protein
MHEPQYAVAARFDERSDLAVLAQADHVAEDRAVGHERNAGQRVGAIAPVMEPDLLDLPSKVERRKVDLPDVVGVSAPDRVPVDDIYGPRVSLTLMLADLLQGPHRRTDRDLATRSCQNSLLCVVAPIT